MTRALIVYGTRYGATASTSEEIAGVLRQEDIDVQVANAKTDKIRDIAEYDLVIVGSGIKINKWTGEAEEFLKDFQKDLAGKKVALFVSCGHGCKAENQGNADVIAEFRGKYLEEKAAKYNLLPIALGFFGGFQDFTKLSWIEKMAPPIKKAREQMIAFYGEKKDFYDTRDLDGIKDCTRELIKKI